jgi:hypothetical protein
MKRIGRPLRVAIADASNLIYSDDYRNGWAWGFKQLGVEVRIFDISMLSKLSMAPTSAYSSKGWNHQPKLMAQEIAKWGPDLLFAHHGRAAANKTFQEYMRHRRIQTACYLCDEPYEVGETARWSPAFNLVFTLDPCTIDIHHAARGMDRDVWYLPPGVNTDHFKYVPYEKRKNPCPALFLGNASLVPRKDYLEQVEREIKGTRILYWQPTGKEKKDQKRWIPLRDHPVLYSSCLVGLNVHRDPAITQQCYRDRVMLKKTRPVQGVVKCKAPPLRWGTGFWNDCNAPSAHVNPRLFEMAAVGTCVISDADRPELARMFPMAPRARTPDEYLDYVKFFVENPERAEAIGRECSNLISKRHTYVHRAAEILIRAGLMDAAEVAKSMSWAEPEEWLTRQDFDAQGVVQSLVPTGLYEHFDPRSGSAATSMSGKPSGNDSLDLNVPWG